MNIEICQELAGKLGSDRKRTSGGTCSPSGAGSLRPSILGSVVLDTQFWKTLVWKPSKGMGIEDVSKRNERSPNLHSTYYYNDGSQKWDLEHPFMAISALS